MIIDDSSHYCSSHIEETEGDHNEGAKEQSENSIDIGTLWVIQLIVINQQMPKMANSTGKRCDRCDSFDTELSESIVISISLEWEISSSSA